MRVVWLTGAAVLALAGGAGAQERAPQEEEITIVATRSERRLDEVPASVSVIDAEEIEANLVSDIKDLVRFEPGVAVRSSPARFTAALSGMGRDGNSGFNIRGLEGNRVLLQVDGVRVPDAFSFGPQVMGRGDYVDLDLLKSVEILRGPGSALYGSDGVAGVVSFTTKDPVDYLSTDESFAARVRASYASADDSWAESIVGAGQADEWSALVGYTRRDGHELDNQGENDAANTNRTTPNPQDWESNAILGRLIFAPGDAHRFRLTYEHFDRSVATEVLSARTPFPPPPPPPLPPLTTTLDLDALDETDRERVSFDHRYEGEGFIERAFWAVYWQQAEMRQFTAEDRDPAADRTRDNTFDNSVWGASGQIDSVFETGAARHRVSLGGDYSSTRQEGVRDGTVPPIGETFPTRAFPNTDYQLAGLFVQDEIAFLDGVVRLYPALRYDYYDLEPEPDALFPGATASQSDSHVSPKFGVVVWPVERLGFFVNYAHGFKAPAPSQVNNGFTNPIQNYLSIPNPDLKPETSETLEGGVRLRDAAFAGARWRASASAFVGAYEDFIDQDIVSGNFAPPPAPATVFQFVNLESVEISGFEARLEGAWDSGFGVRLAFSSARGDQKDGGVTRPLQSVEPFKLVAGLVYDDPQGRFGGQFILTHSDGKDEDRACAPDEQPCPFFLPPDFTIFDLTAYWNITDSAALRVGLFNLTDEKYWWWSDVRGAAVGVDAFTQPGRNVSASLSYRF